MKKIALLFVALTCAGVAHAKLLVSGTIELIPATLMVIKNPPMVPAIKTASAVYGYKAGTVFQIEAANQSDDATIRQLAGKSATINCGGILESPASTYFTASYCALEPIK